MGTGPIPVTVTAGGAFTLDVRGTGLQPFLMAGSTVTAPGFNLGTAGLLDIGFPTPTFNVILDGFAPAKPLDYFARTTGSGSFSISGIMAPGTSLMNFAIQVAVGDPSNAAGYLMTAASDITVAPFTMTSQTFNEGVLGDNVNVTYFHNALSFPFYGTSYGRTFIDTNGYVSFGSPRPSDFSASGNELLAGSPTIAPLWTDLHMHSTVMSQFGNVSPGPASITVTETALMGGGVEMQITWNNATESAGTAAQVDFGLRVDDSGTIRCLYGPDVMGALPGMLNIATVVGISPGGNLSTNTASQTLLTLAGVTAATAAAPNDAIFQQFAPPFATGIFLFPGAQMPPQSLAFQPLGATGALAQTYSVLSL